MAYKYRLYLENGEDIGDFETGTLAWGVGDDLWNCDHHRFCVMNVVEGADLGSDDYCGVLVVAPIEHAEVET